MKQDNACFFGGIFTSKIAQPCLFPLPSVNKKPTYITYIFLKHMKTPATCLGMQNVTHYAYWQFADQPTCASQVVDWSNCKQDDLRNSQLAEMFDTIFGVNNHSTCDIYKFADGNLTSCKSSTPWVIKGNRADKVRPTLYTTTLSKLQNGVTELVCSAL